MLNGVAIPGVKLLGAILGLRNPIRAELVCDGVVLVAVHSEHGMLDGLAVLSADPLDLVELAVVGAMLNDEMRGDLNRVAQINGGIRPRSKCRTFQFLR